MISTHISHLEDYVARGFVVLTQDEIRATVVNPEHVCCSNVRGGGICTLDRAHRGYHSTVTFYCDGCGKSRRGRPHVSNADVAYCFMCFRGII